MFDQAVHHPVLLEKVLELLVWKGDGLYVDCTVGEGGHSEGILNLLSPGGRLIGVDKDKQVLAIAEERLKSFFGRRELLAADFRQLPEILMAKKIAQVDGVLVDLGLSSYQLASPRRGFSFMADGPLDMRFDASSGETAEELINRRSQGELARIIHKFGEERWANRIARAIVQHRKKKKISRTSELRDIITRVVPTSPPYRIHPATRTFQALRIAVNRELEGLREFILSSAPQLAKGGRFVILSYHSLEDRIVKEAFRSLTGRCICPPSLPECRCGTKKILRLLTSKPIRPSPEEIEENPSCRSARLRVGERV
ncbi:16S rRNA (cytosine(1402)-N(4))-methyltransferase [bacterium (candidate division B38) B3_B38]|nr:MAG: 16S rRNA (cytosine(1402)-N(4))-methyltransferase [bacterium (candidate division B38) B3_B38]